MTGLQISIVMDDFFIYLRFSNIIWRPYWDSLTHFKHFIFVSSLFIDESISYPYNPSCTYQYWYLNHYPTWNSCMPLREASMGFSFVCDPIDCWEDRFSLRRWTLQSYGERERGNSCIFIRMFYPPQRGPSLAHFFVSRRPKPSFHQSMWAVNHHFLIPLLQYSHFLFSPSIPPPLWTFCCYFFYLRHILPSSSCSSI